MLIADIFTSTFYRALSSFGRAPRLQRGGDRFKPDRVHLSLNKQQRRGSSSVERSPEEAGVVSSTLTRGTRELTTYNRQLTTGEYEKIYKR